MIERINNEIETRILAKLIVDTDFLTECSSFGKPTLFTTKEHRTIAGWVWDFYTEHGTAPSSAINELYLSRARGLQPTDAELLYTALHHLGRVADTVSNTPLLKQEALKFFKTRCLNILADDIKTSIAMGDNSKAERLIADYVSPASVKSDRIRFGSSDARNRVRKAFTQDDEVLFSFGRTDDDDAEKVLGKVIREDFVAFGAPAKRGKSWFLLDSVIRALSAGLRVYYVSLEMTESQVLRRLWQRLTGTGRKSEEIDMPYFVDDPKGETATIIDTRKFQVREPDMNDDVMQRVQDIVSKYWHADLEIGLYPTRSMTINRLKDDLRNMEVYEGFVPDVIVIDYADIMLLERGTDERDKLNNTWAALRGMAQDRKCAIITASQTGKQTFTLKDAKAEDVSNDVRKTAHVTKLITINQKEDEHDNGIYRLTCSLSRDERTTSAQLYCVGSLAIGNPMMDYRISTKLRIPNEGESSEPTRRRFQRNGMAPTMPPMPAPTGFSGFNPPGAPPTF